MCSSNHLYTKKRTHFCTLSVYLAFSFYLLLFLLFLVLFLSIKSLPPTRRIEVDDNEITIMYLDVLCLWQAKLPLLRALTLYTFYGLTLTLVSSRCIIFMLIQWIASVWKRLVNAMRTTLECIVFLYMLNTKSRSFLFSL